MAAEGECEERQDDRHRRLCVPHNLGLECRIVAENHGNHCGDDNGEFRLHLLPRLAGGSAASLRYAPSHLAPGAPNPYQTDNRHDRPVVNMTVEEDGVSPFQCSPAKAASAEKMASAIVSVVERLTEVVHLVVLAGQVLSNNICLRHIARPEAPTAFGTAWRHNDQNPNGHLHAQSVHRGEVAKNFRRDVCHRL